MSKQPRDDGNDPIPVLGLRPNGGYQVPFTATSNTSPAIAGSIRVVTLYSTQDAFIETGDASVEANTSNSHFLPAQIPYDVSLGAEVITGLEYLTTQDGRTLQDQDLRFIAVEQSGIETTNLAQLTAVFDALTTQAGEFIQLEQSAQILLLDQDFDTAGDSFTTQAGELLVTQDNRAILTQRES